MADKELLFEEMDRIPTRQVTPEQARKELAVRARRARRCLEGLKDADRVSPEVMDRVIDL